MCRGFETTMQRGKSDDRSNVRHIASEGKSEKDAVSARDCVTVVFWGIIEYKLSNNKGRAAMKTLIVKGMHCLHCKAAVEDAVAGVAGVTDARVDLLRGVLDYEENGPVDVLELKSIIENAGFELEL
jgi:copper chaperone